MNELLQKHGCANVFTVPEGLKELMSDITREVLRAQPEKIFDFIANYLSILLITREHGVMAAKILEDLCDCQPTITEHLVHLGIDSGDAEMMAQVINEEISNLEPTEGREKVRECMIIKKILARIPLDEDMSANVCQIIRNAYRDYWYRKKLLEKNMKMHPNEPWEIAAEHTLQIYKRTKPSFGELSRATVKIQAAYRGYHVRRNLLRKLKVQSKQSKPKVELPGPPIDIAGSREIDLGRVLNIKPQEEDVNALFEKEAERDLGLKYDPLKTITHIGEEELAAKTGSKTQKRMQFSSTINTSARSVEQMATDKSAGEFDSKSPAAVMGKSAVDVGDKSFTGKSAVAVGDKSTVGIADKSSVGFSGKSTVTVDGKSTVGIADKSSIGVTKSEVQSKAALDATSDLAQFSKVRQSKSSARQGSPPIISFEENPEVFPVEEGDLPEDVAVTEEPHEIAEELFISASEEGGEVQEVVEVPEDITEGDTGDNTAPTAATADSTDVEDIVTDVGEED